MYLKCSHPRRLLYNCPKALQSAASPSDSNSSTKICLCCSLTKYNQFSQITNPCVCINILLKVTYP